MFEFEKEMRIMTDLVTFCHRLGGHGFNIRMDTVDGVFYCHISCTATPALAAAVAELETELRRPRQTEIEQNYWGLSGEIETGTEMTLIGMMVDTAELTLEGDRLRIHCTRII